MEASPQLIFLGWNGPLLRLVTDWLLDPLNSPEVPDLSSDILVVSTSRAARGLERQLAAKTPEGELLSPPRMVTPFQLAEVLFEPASPLWPAASPVTIRLAWQEAMQQISPENQSNLFGALADAPQSGGQFSDLISVAYQELTSHGLTPGGVVQSLANRADIPEAAIRRWQALEEAASHYTTILSAWRLSDPTGRMNQLLQNGLPKAYQRLILAGITDFPPVFLQGLQRLPAPPLVLVFAPEKEARLFDSWGRVKPEHWENRSIPIQSGQVFRCATSTDQAEAIALFLGHDPTMAPSVVIGVLDSSETPPIVQALAQKNLLGRPVPERTVGETRVWEYLRLIADLYRHRSNGHPTFAAVAAWIRHPDAIRSLGSIDYSSVFDRWQERHLPVIFHPARYESFRQDRWHRCQEILRTLREMGACSTGTTDLQECLTLASEALKAKTLFPHGVQSLWQDLRIFGRELSDLEALQKVDDRLQELLPWSTEMGSVPDQATKLSRHLSEVYGYLELSESAPDHRSLWTPLEVLARELTTLQKLPEQVTIRLVDFLDTLLSELGGTGLPASSLPGSIDLVGWLELLTDESPVALIASCCEGFVPESITSDPLLPGAVRKILQLNDNRQRLARDAYLLTALVESRPGRLWIYVPRRNAQGDPLKPSRLLLNGLGAEALAQRILGLTEPLPQPEPPPAQVDQRSFQVPAPPVQPRSNLELRVTALRDYKNSPRLFYYKHILGLRSVEPESLEISPLLFGNLLHEVLSRFGQSEIRFSSEANSLQAWLFSDLEESLALQFAGLNGPAVRFQVEDIQARLRSFAQRQAEENRQGWRMIYAENQTSEETLRAPFDLKDGRTLYLKGRIDRIDQNLTTGEWRIIDYKTSGKAQEPLATHTAGSGGQDWKDFQLPLYSELVQTLLQRLDPNLGDQSVVPHLHYFLLPSEEADIRVSEPFPPEKIAPCLEEARRLGRLILDGEFSEAGRIKAWEDPALRALCGEVGWSIEEEESDDAS